MFETSELYKAMLADPLHYKEVKLIIAGVEYNESDIISAAIPPVSLFDKFGIGYCVARELDIDIRPKGEIPRQAEIKVYERLVLNGQVSEWIPQGVFYFSTRSKNKLTDSLMVTAFDAMRKADEVWLTADYSSADFPMSQKEAAGDIANRMGVELDPRSQFSTQFPVQYPVDENGDLTMREVLSGIGVSNAANWCMTNEGMLRQLSVLELPAETNYLVTERGEAITIGGVRILVG